MTPNPSSPLPGMLALLIPLAFAAAQSREPSQRVTNVPVVFNSGGYGTQAIALGDHDGDGYADYAVAAPFASDPPGPAGPGVVYLHSGRNGLSFRRFVGDQISSRFGEAMADAGDLNGDGVRDLVTSAIDHDGGGANAGRLYAFSGSTGAVLWTRDGSAPGMNLGKDVAVVGDLDFDGASDLVAGEPAYSVGLAGRGRVVFVSGRTGVVLGTANGPVAFSSVGVAFATRAGASVYVGDALGRVYIVGPIVSALATLTLAYDRPAGSSGVAQMALVQGPAGMRIAIGWPLTSSGGLLANGRIDLFEGTTSVLTVTGAYQGAAVGIQLAAGRDIDGDGEEEIVFAAGATTLLLPDPVTVMRQDGTIVETVSTSAADTASLLSIPDTSGDGRGEWLQAIFSGVASVAECQMFTQGLALPVVTTPSGGLDIAYAFDLAALRGGAAYVVLFSVSGTAPGLLGDPAWPLLPLNLDLITSLALQQANTPLLPGTIGLLGPLGTGTASAALPSSIAAYLTGLPLSAAVVAFAPGGWPPAAVSSPRTVVVP